MVVVRDQEYCDMDLFVACDDHANLDSLPLRFGVTYEQNTTITLTDIEVEARQNNGRYRITAGFKIPDKEYAKGTFIVDKDDPRGNFLVTCWRNDGNIKTELHLSECMKANRIAGYINTNQLLNWHEKYLSGELRTKDDLVSLIISEARHINSKFDKLFDELNRAEQSLWNADFEVEELTKEVNDKSLRIVELSEEKKALEESLSLITQRDRANPKYRGEEIATSEVHTLARVERGHRRKYTGETIACTRLYFADDNVGVRIMDDWADKNGEISTRAEALVGRQVVTTSWKPKIFPPRKWFRNIEAVG